MMQAAYALMGDDATGGHRATSALGRSLPQPQMRAILMIQIDNTTPIVLNLEKSDIPGIRGMGARFGFMKPSSRVDDQYSGAVPKGTTRRITWCRNGCSIRPFAVECTKRQYPWSAAKPCGI
jgi:hypothetical protein